MLDNEILKKKVGKELKDLKLDKKQKDIMVNELNYLSNLLIEVYLKKTQRQI